MGRTDFPQQGISSFWWAFRSHARPGGSGGEGLLMRMVGFSDPPETPRVSVCCTLTGSTMARTGSLGRYALDLNGHECVSDRLRQLPRPV